MNTKKITMFVVVAFSLYFASVAHAFHNQEKYLNSMSEPAYNLTKIIEGEHELNAITKAMNSGCKFNQYVVTYHSGYTKIHWFDGKVDPADTTWACFEVIPKQAVNVLSAYWTGEDGKKLDEAGPPVYSNAINYLGLTVELENSWVEWDDNVNEPRASIGPITISDVYWATPTREFDMAELDGRLYDRTDPLYDPSLAVWQSLDAPNDPVASGETARFELGNLSEGTIVLFRFKAEGAGQTSEEMIQFEVPPEVPPVEPPTLSQWGLIIMALLLVTVGAIMIRKRRQVTT